MTLPHVAVVIPAFRAQSTIEAVLSGIPGFVSLVVVVDDCSPDGTAAVVERFQTRDARVHLARHDLNQGVGAATLTGYHLAAAAGAEIIVKLDSDDQMDPQYLPVLIAPILAGKADYVKGNRFLHRAELSTMPAVRRIGNFGLSFLNKLASGNWDLFDPTNGYTAIHSAVLPCLDERHIARRFFYESSMLIELGIARAIIKDAPIPARYGNEQSSLSVVKSLVQFPPLLIKGFLRRIWQQYYLRDFGLFSLLFPGGAALLSFGLLFGAYHWYVALLSGGAAATGTVMIATLAIILGVQLLLQAISLDIQQKRSEPLAAEMESSRKWRALLSSGVASKTERSGHAPTSS